MTILSRFVLVENYPLYVMLSLASTMAVLTSYRHLMTDTEIATTISKRNYEPMLGKNDENGENPNRNYFAGFFGMVYKTYHNYVNVNK
jgi:hypothetical protein